MTTFELLSVVIAGISLIVSTVVLLFLLMQIRLLRAQVEDARAAQVKANMQAEVENGRLRQRATMEFIAGTMSKLHELYDQVPAAGSPLQTQFLASAMVRDSSEFAAVRNYLNYMEDLSVGINMEIFDKDVVFQTVGGRMKRAWSNYAGWITVERGVLNQQIYSELEICVRELEQIAQQGAPPAAPTV